MFIMRKFTKNKGADLQSKYKEIYDSSIKNRETFWKEVAEDIYWYKKPTRILNSDNPPFYKWFEDGVTNTCYNAIDVLHDAATVPLSAKKNTVVAIIPIDTSQKDIPTKSPVSSIGVAALAEPVKPNTATVASANIFNLLMKTSLVCLVFYLVYI